MYVEISTFFFSSVAFVVAWRDNEMKNCRNVQRPRMKRTKEKKSVACCGSRRQQKRAECVATVEATSSTSFRHEIGSNYKHLAPSKSSASIRHTKRLMLAGMAQRVLDVLTTHSIHAETAQRISVEKKKWLKEEGKKRKKMSKHSN